MSALFDEPAQAALQRCYEEEQLLDALGAYLRAVVRDVVRYELSVARPAEPVRIWLTLEEAGQRLGVSRDAVRMRVRRGRLEARRQGRRLYVSAASVDRLA